MKTLSVKLPTTIESAELDKIVCDIECTLHFTCYPAESATRDYPGCPPMAEYDHCVIDKVTVYDIMGNEMEVGPLFMINMQYVADWVDGWVSKNDESLQYDACEKAGEIAEGLRDDAAEQRFNAMREGD